MLTPTSPIFYISPNAILYHACYGLTKIYFLVKPMAIIIISCLTASTGFAEVGLRSFLEDSPLDLKLEPCFLLVSLGFGTVGVPHVGGLDG